MENTCLQQSKYPIEIRISGDSINDLRNVESQVQDILKPVPGMCGYTMIGIKSNKA